MILTVLVLSSAVLSLSAIGGYLMLIRLRVNSDIVSTTKAIYIADAGLECEAFNRLKKGGADADYCKKEGRNEFSYNAVSPEPDAFYTVEYAAGPPVYILSVGSYRALNRAFRLNF